MIREFEDHIEQLKDTKKEYSSLIDTLKTLPDTLNPKITVPLGKKAFFPGYIKNTNEVFILLGDNYFAKRSAKQTIDIISRRDSDIDKNIQALNDQILNLKQKISLTSDLSKAIQEKESSGIIEIKEEYNSDDEKEHKKKTKTTTTTTTKKKKGTNIDADQEKEIQSYWNERRKNYSTITTPSSTNTPTTTTTTTTTSTSSPKSILKSKTNNNSSNISEIEDPNNPKDYIKKINKQVSFNTAPKEFSKPNPPKNTPFSGDIIEKETDLVSFDETIQPPSKPQPPTEQKQSRFKSSRR
eukprot:gene3265-4088_t